MRNFKRSMTPYVISASDLAFILLFFFIVVGNGATQVERIEMPAKQSSGDLRESAAPFRIEIYDQLAQVDSSRMAVIFTSENPETLFVAIQNEILSQTDAYSLVLDNISRFIQSRAEQTDSVRVDVFSSAYSYYGLVALAVAACNKLQFPCNLVYRAEMAEG